jgi:hypothetical protein
MFAQNYRGTSKRTPFGMMDGYPTHKASTHTEEQVGVNIGQMTMCIKCIAIHCYRNVGGERQILVEDVPMGVMID